jgi:hypothetical protein
MKIVAVVLLAAVTAAVSAQTAPKKQASPIWGEVTSTGIIYELIPDYLVAAGDGSLRMPQGTVGADGRKTYTISTSLDWTCTPASGEANAVVIVCVKNDKLKPAPESKPAK